MPRLDRALERTWIDAQRCRGVAYQQKVESFAETATGLEQRLDSQVVVDATVPEFISFQGRRRRHEFAALVRHFGVSTKFVDRRLCTTGILLQATRAGRWRRRAGRRNMNPRREAFRVVSFPAIRGYPKRESAFALRPLVPPHQHQNDPG